MASELSARIVQIRGKMSQLEFARKLDVNPNTLRNYENGRAVPNQVFLARLCEEFGVNPTWILLGQGLPYIADYEPNHEFETDRELKETNAYLTSYIEDKMQVIRLNNEEIENLINKNELLNKANRNLCKMILSTMIFETKQMKERFEIQKKIVEFSRNENPTQERVLEILNFLNKYIANEIEGASEKIESLSQAEKIVEESTR